MLDCCINMFFMLFSLENIFAVIRHSLYNAEHTYRTSVMSMSVRPHYYYYCYHSAYFGVGYIQLKLIQSLIYSMYVCDHTQNDDNNNNNTKHRLRLGYFSHHMLLCGLWLLSTKNHGHGKQRGFFECWRNHSVPGLARR